MYVEYANFLKSFCKDEESIKNPVHLMSKQSHHELVEIAIVSNEDIIYSRKNVYLQSIVYLGIHDGKEWRKAETGKRYNQICGQGPGHEGL